MKIYEGVLSRTHEYEYKRGISYANVDSPSYKRLKVFYIIALVWTILVNALSAFSLSLLPENNPAKDTIFNIIVMFGVVSALLILGAILNRLKVYITSGIISLVSAIFTLVYISVEFTAPSGFLGFRTDFYFKHVIPLLMLAICITAMTVIAVRAKVKFRKNYQKVTENLYAEFCEKNGEHISEDEWREFLENYDHSEYIKNER